MRRQLQPGQDKTESAGLYTKILIRAAKNGGSLRSLASRLESMRLLGLRGAIGRDELTIPNEAAFLSARHDETYRRIWQQAAVEIGAVMSEFAPGYFRLRRGKAQTLAWRNQVMIDSPATVALAGDKPVLHQLLATNGIATSTLGSTEVREPGTLVDLFSRTPTEYVVKPAKGTSGGQGVTCGVSSMDALLRSWLLARQWSPTVLVEPQAVGDEFRLLFLDGELLGAVRRNPPFVVGDGQRPVRELIAALNQHRLSEHNEEVSRFVHADLDCAMALSKAGLTLGSVPAVGQRVQVKVSVSENGRTDNETWSRFSPELISTASRAVAVAGLRLGGVDLITPDPMRPLNEVGTIIEINATPGFHYHYQVADLESIVPVAITIADCLLNSPEAQVAVQPSSGPRLRA